MRDLLRRDMDPVGRAIATRVAKPTRNNRRVWTGVAKEPLPTSVVPVST